MCEGEGEGACSSFIVGRVSERASVGVSALLRSGFNAGFGVTVSHRVDRTPRSRRKEVGESGRANRCAAGMPSDASVICGAENGAALLVL